MIVIAGVLYAVGIVFARRGGTVWPKWPTIAFYLLGLGSFAWVTFGFLGAYSSELRWAFTTRMALLLFLVPGLMSLGRPVALVQAALHGTSRRIADAVMNSWPFKIMGNAMFSPLFAIAAFTLFLTPFAYTMRTVPGWEIGITVIVPLIGLIMVLPMGANALHRTTLFITVEFLFAFAELVADAIPGIFLRLNNSILDHAPGLVGSFPSWWPTALHDQHLSGDFLWFIAEVADVPILIILFIRWTRTDRKEAKSLDELSDEEMERLTQEHLRSLRERS
jgi:cytochrome c oxidase assembly factor CtaG